MTLRRKGGETAGFEEDYIRVNGYKISAANEQAVQTAQAG